MYELRPCPLVAEASAGKAGTMNPAIAEMVKILARIAVDDYLEEQSCSATAGNENSQAIDQPGVRAARQNPPPDLKDIL